MVDPGICDFPCTIAATLSGHRKVTVTITGSECKQIQQLSTTLTEMTIKELFLPLTRNPVYGSAEKAGCHSSCVVPAAIIKVVEVAMGMALPKDVGIKFKRKKHEEGPGSNECHETTKSGAI
ncbi:MAG: hypothetical protein KFF50_02900 [Desulfatitalea sp.]|nr:hypothetical protein [Desulfatitalea sp.]